MPQKNYMRPLIVILLTGLAVLWLPVFAGYYGLMEADCLAADLSIENADLEISLPGDKSFLLAVVPSACCFQGSLIYYREKCPGAGIFFFGSAPLHRRC